MRRKTTGKTVLLIVAIGGCAVFVALSPKWLIGAVAAIAAVAVGCTK